MKAPAATTAWRWAARIACVWFFAATLHAAFHIELGFDPAYHATVAKNFADGHGWASSYERAFPFNPDVTTGPAMLLPAAGLMALFGNALWVPAVSAALLQLALYALILLRLKRYFEHPAAYGACVLSLTLMFVVYAHTWWLSLTADFLVCLALLLCVLYAAAPDVRHPRRDLFCAGLALGYALLAKALALFGVAGLLLYWMLQRRPLRELWPLLLGVLVLVLPWKLYELLSLSTLAPDAYAERAAYAREFFWSQGTGLSEIAASHDLFSLLHGNLSRNGGYLLDSLWSRYHVPALLTLAALLALLIFTVMRARSDATPAQRLLSALGLIATLQMGWYLLLSPSWNAKYTLAPIVLGLVLLCIVLAPRRAVWAVIVPLLLSPLWLPGATRAYVMTLVTFSAQDSDYTREMRSTRDALLAHPQTPPLAGCGWMFAPWEFEYLLPGTLHFRDCRALIAEALALDEADYLARNPGVAALLAQGQYRSALDHLQRSGAPSGAAFRFVWTKPVEFDLVVNHVFWRTSAYRDDYLPLLAACGEPALQRGEYFSVLHCSAEALRRAVPLDRPSALLPLTPPQLFVHKPAPLR